MSDLEKAASAARKSVHPQWGSDEIEVLTGRFHRARRRRPVFRAATTVVALALLVWGVQRTRDYRRATIDAHGERRDASELVAGQADPIRMPLSFPDGSHATALTQDTLMFLRELSDTHARIDLARGGGFFSVAHRPTREFRVDAAGVTVRVLGTSFEVERTNAGVRVAVRDGQVQVDCDSKTTLLGAGEERMFASSGSPALAPVAVATASNLSPSSTPSRTAASGTSWRGLAAVHDFSGAYLEYRQSREAVDAPADLLLLADVARLSQHPAEAVPPLRRFLHRFPQDERAAVASFTLGRVMTDLGRPAEAAGAFARAGSGDSTGALKDDALAREFEAWIKAGDAVKARERARQYLRLYPTGLHVASAQRYAAHE